MIHIWIIQTRILCVKIEGEGGIWLRCLKTHYTVKAYLFKKTKSHQLFHGEFGSSFALKKNLSGHISTSPALLKYVINRRKITKEGAEAAEGPKIWGATNNRFNFCSVFFFYVRKIWGGESMTPLVPPSPLPTSLLKRGSFGGWKTVPEW